MNNSKLIEPGKWHVDYDADGHRTSYVYEESTCILLGYESREEYISALGSWDAAIHPDDIERVNKIIADVESKHPEGMDYDAEYRIMTKRGYCRIHDYGRVYRSEDGTPIHVDGVAFNIQDIVEKEKAVKLAEQRKSQLEVKQAVHPEAWDRLFGAVPLSSDILIKENIGLWAFELDEGCEPRMYVDDAMLKLIGLDEQKNPEETYHAWYDYIDPAHYDEVANAVEKMTSGVHAEVQYPWHNPNGETWIVRCGGVRNYAYEKGIRIEGTHQNVTHLSHFQKKTLGDMLSGLSDDFLDVYFLDPYTGSFESYANQTSYDGDDKRDFSKVNFYEDVAQRSGGIVHPEDKPLIDKMYSRENLIHVVESGEPQEFVVRWPTGNGDDLIYMQNKLSSYIDEDGSRKLIIGVRDVTQEQQAQKSLEEKNAYLEHFLDGFSSAYIVDLANDSFEILHMTHEFRQVFMENGNRSDMENFIEEHIHPDDCELMRKMSDGNYMRTLLEKDKDVSFTARELFDGVEKTMRVIVIRGADSSRAAVGFMDITEELNKEKENSRKLEAANNAKSAFLFNMSHDIRTPMNAILGYTDIALRHADDRKKVDEVLRNIKVAGVHLLELINDILEMSRIESGKLELTKEPMDIRKLVEGVEQMNTALAIKKSIVLKTQIGDLRNPYVYSDELHINEVLINLISNAIKYTPEGGSILFKVNEISDVSEGKVTYRFEVEDNGIGMSEEFQTHLFEAFAREKSSTVSKQEGAGLGLSIVKNIVDLAGGTIKAESKPGEGSTFIVEIPFCVMDEEAITRFVKNNETHESVEPLYNFEGRKVLLVEDNDMNREIAREILEEAGIIIDTAEDGDFAVRAVTEKGADYYDFILMDIQMPVMDGYEATKAIRALPKGEEVSIIALSANAFEEDIRKSLGAGMNAHVAKPVDIKVLFEVMQGLI